VADTITFNFKGGSNGGNDASGNNKSTTAGVKALTLTASNIYMDTGGDLGGTVASALSALSSSISTLNTIVGDLADEDGRLWSAINDLRDSINSLSKSSYNDGE
jgi:hypothetical protein